ncbi:MAG: hypothetical protein AB1489_27625 [Acidobacteriota bacterium]
MPKIIKKYYLRIMLTLAIAIALSLNSSLFAASTLQLNFLYVHGVKGCDPQRLNAENSLNDLEAAINAELPNFIQAYQSSHPDITIVTQSVRANLYTAPASPYHPSDSTNPLHMDDWEVGDPGCNTTVQGQPCTTAYEWRYRLKRVIETAFPQNAKNIIIIGHSTGARTAMEVAANVGPNGVGTMDWGVQNKIAGVVTVQGMLDGLNSNKYNVIGAASFVTTCKNGDFIMGFGSSCALGNGWCEYAGLINGFAAADWVSQNKHGLMLISYASCSPSLWTGNSDGPLPFDAQGSPQAVGLNMTVAPGKTWRPAHGQKYGSFCHSAITDSSNSGHMEAVNAARSRILNWIFNSAPRTAATNTVTTSTLAYNSSATYNVGSSCGLDRSDGGIQVTGVCRHPGFFDGDDHVVAASELTITDGLTCNGAFKWTQLHDKNNKHAAVLTWKTYSLPAEKNLLSTLMPN